MAQIIGKEAITALLLLGSASIFVAQEPKKTDPPDEDKQVVKSSAMKSIPAASVKFRKDLNLPFASLGTLGSRIDAARRAGDPVTLALAAGELDLAEKVSGKTTSLTSKKLLAEAAELATLRKQNAELQAVLQMSDKIEIAQNQLTNLKQQIAFTQKMTADAKQALQKKEEPTNAPRKVVVNNYSSQYIDIQVNGYLKGQVNPGTTQVFTIDQIWNPIVLKGWGDADETIFGPVLLQGRFTTYTWNINADSGTPNPDGTINPP